MRLSFSTRGWQRLGWEELLATAADTGLEGVELYDLPKRQDLCQRGGPFDKYNLLATARQLRERGLRIPCLDTSCDLAEEGSYLTPPFSPGYGDWDLSVQGRVLDLLTAHKRIGLTLTAGGMLVPEKSVTAVVGLSDREEDACGQKCMRCTKTDCPFRASD